VRPYPSTSNLYVESNEARSMGLPSVSEFTPHPLSEKVYGSPEPDEELIESIEKVGILQPIVVDRNKRILAGHRRWQACKIIAERRPDKDFRILAITFGGSDFQAEQLIIESNRQRVKTLEQKGREFKELKRIEAALAKERMLAGRKIDPGKNFSKGRAEDNAASAVGMSRPTAKKLEAIVERADSGDCEARAALDALNENKIGVDSAYRRAYAPKRDIAVTDKDDQAAQGFNHQGNNGDHQGLERGLADKARALDAEVFRGEHEGRFHLTIYNLTKARLSQLLEYVESSARS
jgi:hypothetical protein